jgi:hypothetical protein
MKGNGRCGFNREEILGWATSIKLQEKMVLYERPSTQQLKSNSQIGNVRIWDLSYKTFPLSFTIK